MSTRQNKKGGRKGRNNNLNRERTVTQLTDGPEAPFISPIDDINVLPLSPPFSVNSAAPNSSNSFQMAPSFSPVSYGPFGIHPPMFAPPFAPQHQPQLPQHPPFFQPQSPLPSGPNDLVILENLKKTILSNQHEKFRPIPQPAFLESIYHGPRSVSQVPSHPEQVPPAASTSPQNGAKSQHETNNNVNNTSLSAIVDAGRRVRQESSWDSKSSQSAANGSQATHNATQPSAPGLRLEYSFGSNAVSLPPKLFDESRSKPQNVPSTASVPGLDSVPSQRVTKFDVPPSAVAQSRFQKLDARSPDKPPPTNSESVRPSGDQSAKPYDDKNDGRLSKDTNWAHRAGAPDDKPRYDSDRPGISRFNDNAINRGPGRFYDRDRDRDRDPKDREWDRDRDGRDRRPDFRFREERNNHNGINRQVDTRRPYESRFQDRRFDIPKPPNDLSVNSTRPGPPAEERSSSPRAPGDERRPLGEERSFGSLSNRSDAPVAARPLGVGDDRHERPPLPATDRLGDRRRPPSPADERQVRPAPDNRRPHVKPGERQFRLMDDRRLPPPSSAIDRSSLGRPTDERRFLPSPPAAANRDPQGRPSPPGMSDDRRPPPSPVVADRIKIEETRRSLLSPPVDRVRPVEDRRGLPSVADRQVRPDDRRPAPPSIPPPPSNSGVERQSRPPSDERRSAPSVSVTDRVSRPTGDDRRPPLLSAADNRMRVPLSATDVLPSSQRSPVEDRNLGSRPQSQDDRGTRQTQPSLQERISHPVTPTPGRAPEDRSNVVSRPDDRNANINASRSIPSLEERLHVVRITPVEDHDRVARPPLTQSQLDNNDRITRPPSTQIVSSTDRDRLPRPPSDDHSMLMAEPARPPVPSAQRPDDRGRPSVSDRFAPPAPMINERAQLVPPPPRAVSSYPSGRASSVAREDPRIFRPRSRSHSPRREFRPANDARPPFRPEADRFGTDRRPDLMDVDPPARFSEPRASYRRASPPLSSLDPYAPRTERSWAPDAYQEEPPRRVAPASVEPHAYQRDWRDEDRIYPDGWDARGARTWDRPVPLPPPPPPVREFERFVERDTMPHVWETREERDRRVFPASEPPPPPAVRSFEQRPLSSRLTEGYGGDGYGRETERARYPGIEPSQPPYSRIRARSPSPLRRVSGPIDDMRPPIKRARDDAYANAYYASPPPPSTVDRPIDYARMRTPPPPSGGFYDDHPPYSSPVHAARDKEFADARERGPDIGYVHPSYDRRMLGRMPPPRSPPYATREPYGRDDRRYSIPPRG